MADVDCVRYRESPRPVIRGTTTDDAQMLGYAADLAFYYVPVHKPGITGLNWRLMLGSAGFPALIVMCQMPFLPESPRWLMGKGRYKKAYESMLRLRGNPVTAARDIYYMFVLLNEEASIVRGHNRFLELFTIGRNRRAAQGAGILMFGQQFCGINAIGESSAGWTSATPPHAPPPAPPPAPLTRQCTTPPASSPTPASQRSMPFSHHGASVC